MILVTRSGCGPCGQFLAGPWRSLKDELSYGIGGAAVEHIDVVTDGIEKVPPAVRKNLQFVPQLFALYADNTVETPKNPVNSPQGAKELQQWVSQGPPRYSKASVVKKDDDMDALINPRYSVIAVTSPGCAACMAWEGSGGLQKFLDSLPATVDKVHYASQPTVTSSPEETRRRSALSIITGVPSVIVVNTEKWLHPISAQLQQSDVMLSPAEVRQPEGLALFKRWLTLLTDQHMPFLGYMILATDPGCGYCRQWKESGGMDDFIKTNKTLPGILLIHNDAKIPRVITSHINSLPSVYFVAADQWNLPNPEVTQGPDPRNAADIAEWVRQIEDGSWSNDPSFVPADYRQVTASRAQMRAPPARRPLKRQAFR